MEPHPRRSVLASQSSHWFISLHPREQPGPAGGGDPPGHADPRRYCDWVCFDESSRLEDGRKQSSGYVFTLVLVLRT